MLFFSKIKGILKIVPGKKSGINVSKPSARSLCLHRCSLYTTLHQYFFLLICIFFVCTTRGYYFNFFRNMCLKNFNLEQFKSRVKFFLCYQLETIYNLIILDIQNQLKRFFVYNRFSSYLRIDCKEWRRLLAPQLCSATLWSKTYKPTAQRCAPG